MQLPGIALIIIIVVLIISYLFWNKRSLVAECVTAILLIIFIFATDIARQVVEFVINGVLLIGSLLVARLQGTPSNSANFTFGTSSRIAEAVIIIAAGLLAYAVGSVAGAKSKNKHTFWAFVVRSISLLLFIGTLLNMWVTNAGQVPGNNILAGTRIDPPSINPPSIVLTSSPNRNPLADYLPWMVALAIGIVLVYAVTTLFLVPPTKKRPEGKPRTRYGLLAFVGIGIGLAIVVAALGIPRLR